MKLIIDIDEDVRIAISRMGVLRIPDEMQKKVDEAIQRGTPIPDNATNGDVIKAMFSNVEIYTDVINEIVDVEICEDSSELRCCVDWWNSPYQKGGNE